MHYPLPPGDPPEDEPGRLRGVVLAELRRVLGRIPTGANAGAVEAALDRSFALSTEDGVDVWVWRRQSDTAGSGPAGDQPSLAAFAEAALGMTMPLIDELAPLAVDADPDALAAARASFKDSCEAFLAELRRNGGLRAARADDLLDRCADRLRRLGDVLGAAAVGTGQPGREPQRVEVSARNVVTLADEEQLGNFVVVRDVVETIATAWARLGNAAEGNFAFGMALARVEQALTLIAAVVDEVRSALDTVGMADEQGQALAPDDDVSMSLDEVLAGVDDFARDGARAPLESAGLESVGARVEAFAGRFDRLLGAIRESLVAGGEPTGPAHPHVRARLRLLERALCHLHLLLTGRACRVRDAAHDA